MSNVVPLWTQVPHAGYYINSVAVSADGGVVAAGTFFHTYSSSTDIKLAERVAAAQPPIDDLTPSQYGTFGTYVWNRSGTLLMQSEFVGWQGVYWVDLSGDGSVVASCGWHNTTPSYRGFIAAYSVATGGTLLFYEIPVRGNVVSLDAYGAQLLAGADQGYLFSRGTDGTFGSPPATIALTASGDSTLVTALDASGSVGLIASYQGEVILFQIDAGTVGTLARWQLPASAYLHFAALSSDGSHAYVGANNGTLYAINVARFLEAPAPMWSAALPSGATTIYGVACSSNGGLAAAAGNASDGGVVGYYADKYNNGAMYWKGSTAHSPNSVSMDAAGRWVALADGHPDGTPGCFYLWQGLTGDLLWSYPTSDMSWPIKLSADGSLVVGGSDNGSVYVFAGPAPGAAAADAAA